MPALTRKGKVAITWVMFCMIISNSAQTQDRYQNVKYEFSVALPRGLRMCRTVPPNPDHGIIVPLEPSNGCEITKTERIRRVYLSGEFNAAETRDLDQLKFRTCADRGIPLPSPKGLYIPNERTVSCSVEGSNGYVRIWVLAQDNRASFIDDWVNYEFDLDTTPGSLSRDLQAFRDVLRGIKIEKNPAQDVR